MKRQLSFFLLIGSIGFVIDSGITQGLTSLTAINPFFARMPAMAVAICVSFVLHSRFTFASHTQAKAKAFGAFLVTNAASQSVNYGIYAGLVFIIPLFQTWPIFAVMAGSISAMTVTFVLSKFWVFKA